MNSTYNVGRLVFEIGRFEFLKSWEKWTSESCTLVVNVNAWRNDGKRIQNVRSGNKEEKKGFKV